MTGKVLISMIGCGRIVLAAILSFSIVGAPQAAATNRDPELTTTTKGTRAMAGEIILAIQSDINPKTGLPYKCNIGKRDYSIKFGRANVARKAAWRRAWRAKKHEEVRVKRSAYRAALQAKGGQYVMENRWRVMLAHFLKIQYVPKSKKYNFGCTPMEYRAHIEKQFLPGMTWDNRGPVWHLDHIRPIHTYDLTNPRQALKAFHYTNTRPQWRDVNMAQQPRRLP